MSSKSPPRENREKTVSTQAEPEPANVNQSESDGWWDAPIPNRVTAAFHIGRLLNQLNWHLQHVLFFVSPRRQEDGR